jgi:hypothetical protein
MSTPILVQRLRAANPFPANRIENDVLLAEIVARPGDPRLAVPVPATRRPLRRRLASKRALLFAAAALLLPASAVGGIAGWSIFGPSKSQLQAERGGTLIPGSLRTLRTLEGPDGTTWRVVTYETTKYDCLDVYGGITGSAEPAGAVGGCGLPPFDPNEVIQSLGTGGVSIGAEFFSVAEGRVAPRVATVRARFTDGSTAVDHPEGGIWLFVSSPQRSPVLLEALDENGNVLARLPLP